MLFECGVLQNLLYMEIAMVSLFNSTLQMNSSFVQVTVIWSLLTVHEDMKYLNLSNLMQHPKELQPTKSLSPVNETHTVFKDISFFEYKVKILWVRDSI